MNLPELRIGKLKSRLPIIQGGMGVGVSLNSLASAVARAGGIGVIAGAAIGFAESDVPGEFVNNCKQAMTREVELAKANSDGGPIGVNLMVALNEYEMLARVAAEAGADIIFCGAGLPMNLPSIVGDTDVSLVPIVSSGRAASILCKAWSTRHNRFPDAIVVEGPLAGGHLGFTYEQLQNIEDYPLSKLVTEVIQALEPWQDRAGQAIPVIGAGGVFTGTDIAELLALGAGGVQMGTRFVCTEECDASDDFKKSYLNATKEDIGFIQSPVGMPGRAIRNQFLSSVEGGWEVPVYCPYHCIKTCIPETSPYCIASALDNARQGNLESGFVFAGANAYRCDRILTVQELMDELEQEASTALEALRSGAGTTV